MATDLERFGDYLANPSTEGRNKLAESYLEDMRRLAVFMYRRYRGTLLGDVEDYIGDCHLTLLKCISTYDVSIGVKFTTFLCVCIHRKLRRKVSEEKRIPTVFTEKDVEDYRGEKSKDIDIIEHAKKHLGEKIVQLRFVEGKTLKETAKILGVNRNLVIRKIGQYAKAFRESIDAA